MLPFPFSCPFIGWILEHFLVCHFNIAAKVNVSVAQSCPTLSDPMDYRWTIAYQAPVSMGFSQEEYWSGLPFPTPEDSPEPGIEPTLRMFHWKAEPGRIPAMNGKNPGDGEGLSWDSDWAMKRRKADAGED